MARTLAQLRREVGGAIGELVLVTATDASGAGAGTFRDRINLVDSANAFASSDLLITSGDCEGHRARITSSERSTQTITFAPVCASAIDVGDTAEIYGAHGHIRLAQLDAWIREAQNDAFPNFLVPLVETLPDAFDLDDPTIDVSAGFTHVHALTYPSTMQGDVALHAGRYNDGEGWFPIPGRRIQIDGLSRGEADGHLLTVHGFGREDELEADSDTTNLDPEWIKLMVAGYFYQSIGDPRRDQMGALRLSRADALRAKIITPTHPHTREVIP